MHDAMSRYPLLRLTRALVPALRHGRWLIDCRWAAGECSARSINTLVKITRLTQDVAPGLLLGCRPGTIARAAAANPPPLALP